MRFYTRRKYPLDPIIRWMAFLFVTSICLQVWMCASNESQSLKVPVDSSDTEGQDRAGRRWRGNVSVWPREHDEQYDRILEQLDYRSNQSMQRVMWIQAIGFGGTPAGQTVFLENRCPVSNCLLSHGYPQKHKKKTADAIIFEWNYNQARTLVAGPWQVTIAYQLEPPTYRQLSNTYDFNWTATYRRDSTLVTPYEKFAPFLAGNSSKTPRELPNYARGKTKLVAWFVSNCGTQNGRLAYAAELAKHVTVDVYGACGTHVCLRANSDACFRMLKRDYKFYLAFENSNCRDYITEKFYWNALYNDVVPIVMGAHPDDYRAVAPPNSYIHVDDFESPRHLAAHLRILDQNDAVYSKYFEWKGTGEFINTKFWCRLCALLHAREATGYTHWYRNTNDWWAGNLAQREVCVVAKAGRWATWRHPLT